LQAIDILPFSEKLEATFTQVAQPGSFLLAVLAVAVEK